MKVVMERDGSTLVVTINRPEVRNTVDGETAILLADAFRKFEVDSDLRVAILTGAGGHFCSGADLKAAARGEAAPLTEEGDSPMGPLRQRTTKPVLAAVSGYAVAGGMALAAWCDLRVTDHTAVFGMFDRRAGVPIFGNVTATLPRLIGMSVAMDIVLTGRALDAARELAAELAGYPWECLVSDRLALLENADLPIAVGQRNEFRRGMAALRAGGFAPPRDQLRANVRTNKGTPQ